MFLTEHFDMSASCWSEDDLEKARVVFRAVFDQIDPDWPMSPIGPLSNHWKGTASPSVSHCVHVARIMHVLSRGVTERSVPILHTKIRELLNCPDDSAIYEQRLTELEVGAYLSEKHSPVALEPLVPPDIIGGPNPPKSPDYAIRLRR